MKTVCLAAFAGLILVLAACRKSEDNYNPYPVWILNVFVYQISMDPTNPLQPLHPGSNPQAMLHLEPSGQNITAGLMHNSTNRIHAWQHIDSIVMVDYFVRCDHYLDSEHRLITFDASRAVQGPGRDGPEVIVNDTISLFPVLGGPN